MRQNILVAGFASGLVGAIHFDVSEKFHEEKMIKVPILLSNFMYQQIIKLSDPPNNEFLNSLTVLQHLHSRRKLRNLKPENLLFNEKFLRGDDGREHLEV